jgi:SAM-dependent methyltransferase
LNAGIGLDRSLFYVKKRKNIMSMKMMPHDSWAEVYDEVYKRSFGKFYSDLTKVTMEVIDQIAPKYGKIIDFGAGTGRLSIPLAQKGYQVTAVEPSQAMLEQLQKKKENLPIQMQLARMDEYADEAEYDLALCVFTVILYLLDEASLEKSFQAVYSTLKKDGLLLLDIPTHHLFQNAYYSDENMERTVQIEQKDDGCYNYKEKVIFQKKDKSYHYSDSFMIRYWEEETVLNLLEKTGFKIEKDLSTYFLGSGSHYYVFRK